MHDLPANGFIYVKGKIGSFASFLLSRSDRKTILFYEAEDEALLIKEELEFFSGREVFTFPAYSDKVFEKEDELKRVGFLSHLASDTMFFGLFPYSAINHPLKPPEEVVGRTKELVFGDTVFRKIWCSILMNQDTN